MIVSDRPTLFDQAQLYCHSWSISVENVVDISNHPPWWCERCTNYHQPKQMGHLGYTTGVHDDICKIKQRDSVYSVNKLTHWGRHQMNAISQMTFSITFSWNQFRLRFHWSLFLRFDSTIFHHWFRSWLGALQTTSHYLNQWWLNYWRLYASLGLNELRLEGASLYKDCLIMHFNHKII